MVMTSMDIENQSFSIDRKGYDVDEVDVFLEQVAHELDDMNNQIAQLQAELDGQSGFGDSKAQADSGASDELLAEKDARIAELERQIEDKRADDNAIAQALIIAQRSADEIRTNANSDAEQTKEDAKEEAQRILDKANTEKQKILEAIETLENDREDVRAEYQTLLKDFVNSANKKLSEIGGPATSGNHSAPRKSSSSDSVSKSHTPLNKVSTAAATYTTPQSGSAVVTPATPKPSQAAKDLSGFGDADSDFEFDELD